MEKRFMKVACLSILVMGGNAWAMDVPQNSQTILDQKLVQAIVDPNWSLEQHIKNVKLLLDQGANANIQSEFGVTPLMGAALLGDQKICELLIAYGANVNAQDKGGRNALSRSIEEGHKEVCKLLIKAMIDHENALLLTQRTIFFKKLKDSGVFNRDMVQMLTKQLQESQRAEMAASKSKMQEQIMRIQNRAALFQSLKQELSDYLKTL
jgi:ankyrin repeat protein